MAVIIIINTLKFQRNPFSFVNADKIKIKYLTFSGSNADTGTISLQAENK